MIDFNSLEYKEKRIVEIQKDLEISMDKTHFPEKSIDQYFVKIGKVRKNNIAKAGYMYFCMDRTNKEAYYIGSYINPKYRQQGLSTLLTSYWIKLCLDNGITNLATIARQRKPFILYVLKKFSFDVRNILMYQMGNNVDICLQPNDNKKYLHFENKAMEIDFKESSIAQNDNFLYLPEKGINTIVEETILLEEPLFIRDQNLAYNTAEEKIKTLINRR